MNNMTSTLTRRRRAAEPQRILFLKEDLLRGFALCVNVAFVLIAAGAAVRLSASDPGTGDWPMWGGTPDRNMVSNAKGLPTDWDVKTKKNIKWVADLGSQSYGNPVVAGGMVFVGTNNEGLRDPKQPGDRGVLMAFRETDGEFLWQHTHAKLEAGRANDWPYQGVASSPLVEGKTLYYVSNRAVLFAVDIEGFRDKENDGPVTDEKLTGMNDADVIWAFDMMEEVGTYPHNLANSSPVVWGDLIFVSTSNGQDESHVNIPSPRAPSIIAVNKTTGKLVWEDNSVEDRILHGQWSPPSVGTIGGVVQVVSAQGDGWVRGYEAQTGKKLWEFDTNPKETVWPKTRNELIATPVIVGDRVYLANGQDPEHGEGVGNFYAIDATKRGDITQSGRLWHFTKIRRSISTAAVADGLVYISDFSGFLYCLDADTGKEIWMHDLFAAVWGSPFVVDGKVYIGDEDGDVTVLAHGREKKVLAEMNMGSSVYATVTPAHGTIFLNNRNQLFAIANKISEVDCANAMACLRARRRAVVGRVRRAAPSRPGDARQPAQGAAVRRRGVFSDRRADSGGDPRLAGQPLGLQSDRADGGHDRRRARRHRRGLHHLGVPHRRPAGVRHAARLRRRPHRQRAALDGDSPAEGRAEPDVVCRIRAGVRGRGDGAVLQAAA